MEESKKAVRILVFGDVSEEKLLPELFEKIEKFHSNPKSGPFDFVLCLGNLFDENHSLVLPDTLKNPGFKSFLFYQDLINIVYFSYSYFLLWNQYEFLQRSKEECFLFGIFWDQTNLWSECNVCFIRRRLSRISENGGSRSCRYFIDKRMAPKNYRKHCVRKANLKLIFPKLLIVSSSLEMLRMKLNQ